MAIVTIDDAKLTSIADAIRAKAGTSATLTTDEMPTAINDIVTAPEYNYWVGLKGTSSYPTSAILDFQNYTSIITYTSLVDGSPVTGNMIPPYAFYNWGTTGSSSLSSYGVSTSYTYRNLFNRVTGSLNLELLNGDSVIFVGNNAFQAAFFHTGSRTYKFDIKTAFPNLRVADNYSFASGTRFTINDELPENIEWIGANAFVFQAGGSSTSSNPAMNFTKIPASCKYIGNAAFASSGLYASYIYRDSTRTSLTFEGTPQYIGNNAFSAAKLVSTITDVYVPWAATDNINANAPWGLTNATIHYSS